MIGLADTLVLAGAKLRSHKIRTTITVGLSSLLFAILIAAIILAQGTMNSLAVFNKQALNGKYLVLATTDSPISFIGNGSISNPETIALAKQLYSQIVDAKTKDAAKLGVSYSPKSEPEPTSLQENPGHPSTEHLNITTSYAAQQALAQYVKDHPSPGLTQLQELAKPYNPKAIYVSQAVGTNGGMIEIMEDGKENFAATDDEKVNLDFLFKVGIEIDDPGIVEPFISKDVTVDKDAVPIVAPYDSVEKMLGLSALPANATSQQKYDRIQELYKKITDTPLEVTTCYRNSVSSGQITEALDYQQNSSSKDYQKPDVVYGLPDASACGAVPIISDSRTETQKEQQKAEDQFNANFGGVVTPVQKKIVFQVIGLTPTVSDSNKTTFGGLLGNITGSSLGEVYAIPSNLLDQMGDAIALKSIFTGIDQESVVAQALSSPSSSYGYTLEFSSADDARHFINDQGCSPAPTGGTCSKPNQFHLQTAGNNSLALEDLQTKTTNLLLIAAGVAVFLAIIIMTAMIGRTIGDSRHETAVFRALGAERTDIGVIYIVYTVWISAIIAIVALVLGVGATYIFNLIYQHSATLEAKILFDSVNTSLTFNFFSLNFYVLGGVMVLVILTGLFSTIIPLLRNVPRSPIRDMREG